MAIIYKPLSAEINLASNSTVTSATNVGQGVTLRITNVSTAVDVLTFYYANGTQYANMSILPTSSILVWKNNTDSLVADGNVKISIISLRGI